MSDVPKSGSPTITQPVPSPDLRDTVVSSYNQQFDTTGKTTVPEFHEKSYQHYSYLKVIHNAEIRFWLDDKHVGQKSCKAYLEPDIKKELKKLNDDSWNNIEDYLEPVGPQRVTIVHLAAYAGRRDILERGAQLYADKSTVFKNRTNGESTDPMLATDKFGRCALHYAAFEGHDGVVSWILDKWGSDHSIPHPQISLEDGFGRTPLNDAVGRLNVDVVKLLVNNGAAVNVLNKRGIPWYLPLKQDGKCVCRLDAVKVSERYYNFVKFLLHKRNGEERKLDIDINFGHPETGWTMLHHAILLKNHKAVKYLVKHGANPNKNGKCQSRSRYSTPYEDGISELQYAALESDFQSIRLFFDNDGNLARPYPQRNRTVIDDLRLQSNDQDIMNFLTSIFDARLRFAIFPNFVRLDYRVLAPLDEPRKMAVISVLMKSLKREELHTILKHPFLQMYIGKRWSRFSEIFYIIFLLHIFFVIFLSWYTIHLVNNNSDSATLRWLMFTSAFSLFCLNLSQFLMGPKWNLKQSETWLLFLSLTLSMCVAVIGQVNSNSSWVRHILSWIFPLVGGQMMLLIDHFVLPSLGHHALLIPIVLKSVLQILFIGSFIVAGFSVSFFILFHKNPQFDSLWKTFSKTIVMMTGEYEYGDLFTLISPNNETEHNPVDSQQEIYDNLPFVTGRIVLIIFVIIASIVFMNLMVGLAVRDVQALVNEGQIDRLLKQVEFITHNERMTESCFFRGAWIPNCLKKWAERTNLFDRTSYYEADTPPRYVSKEVWRTILVICKENRNSDKQQTLHYNFIKSNYNRCWCVDKSKMTESSLDNRKYLIFTETALAAMQSAHQSIVSELGQIRQFIESRNADV